MNMAVNLYKSISVRPLQPTIGAEISGVDLTRPLTRSVRDEIYAALLRHGVVFFRDQPIDRAQHVAFARAFGKPENNAVSALLAQDQAFPEVTQNYSEGKGTPGVDCWHTDGSDHAVPPLGAVLRGFVIPSLGGDTVFSSSVSAYAALDDRTKQRIENLRAVHSLDQVALYAPMTREQIDQLRRHYTPIEHPVVRIHPDTGERTLFVSQFYTSHIVGMDPIESRALLDRLCDEFKRPEHQVRFAWRPHSIAFWDNRAVQHYAVQGYDEPRKMERVMIEGTRPTGPGQTPEPQPLPDLPG